MPASDHEVARDITYSSSAKGRSGRAMIRVMENATGRLRLIRKARGYDHDVAAGHDFWEVMSNRYGLPLEVVAAQHLEGLPEPPPSDVLAIHFHAPLKHQLLTLPTTGDSRRGHPRSGPIPDRHRARLDETSSHR